MMSTSRTLATVLASLLSAASSVGAQQRDTVRADTTKLVPVTVTETRAVGVVGGASAVVIEPDQLRSSPAPVLEQALRESPFVHVRQNSRGEMELSIRGSDSRQAAVLVDGVPITLGFDHRTDPSLVPLTGAQNLVIVRGLSSLLNGPNTLGGTIEVSHDDAFGRLGSGRLWGGAGVDENAAYVASIGGGRDLETARTGDVSIRGGIAFRDRRGFTLPSGAPDPTAVDGLRTNSDMREADAFGALRWTGGAGRSMGLLVSGFDARRGVPPEEHVSNPRLWRYPYHRRVVATLSGNAGTVATPFGFATLEGGVGLNAGRAKIESYSDRSYSTVVDEERGDEQTWTGRVRLGHSLPAGAQLRAALTGAIVTYDETLPSAPVAAYEQQLWSGGAELDLPLGAAARTRVSGGVVYDRASTPRTGGRTPEQDSFDNIGWRAGITHDLFSHTRVHASASRRSRFPALRELYSGALDRFQPNPDLEPETLLGVEAGLTMDRAIGPIPDATLQMNAFHHDLRDAVVRITLPAPDRRFRRVNRDRIRSTGLELLGGMAFSSQADRAVTLTGDATIQDISISDQLAGGIRHAENNPEVRAMLELGAPLPARLRGFANARYTGAQYCIDADTGGEMELPARTQTNLALERRFSLSTRGAVRAVRAVLALDNATNSAIYDQCGLPQPGRTLRLMISFQ
jgi:iron complex outermembrane receptor protein